MKKCLKSKFESNILELKNKKNIFGGQDNGHETASCESTTEGTAYIFIDSDVAHYGDWYPSC